MATIKGTLRTMTTDISVVSEVWVQATEIMPRNKDVIVTETKKIPVIDGEVEFKAYPGRATIVLVYLDTTPNTPIPIFVTDEENQTLGDVITAGRIDENTNPTEIENLTKQALEAVNAVQGTSDAAVAAAKEAAASQKAAKDSQDAAKASEEAAGSSEVNAKNSQEMAKISEGIAIENSSAAITAQNEASKSQVAAAASEKAAGESAANAKESENKSANYADILSQGAIDGSISEKKLAPALATKVAQLDTTTANMQTSSPNVLVKTDGAGKLYSTFTTPSNNNELVNKQYVDSVGDAATKKATDAVSSNTYSLKNTVLGLDTSKWTQVELFKNASGLPTWVVGSSSQYLRFKPGTYEVIMNSQSSGKSGVTGLTKSCAIVMGLYSDTSNSDISAGDEAETYYKADGLPASKGFHNNVARMIYSADSDVMLRPYIYGYGYSTVNIVIRKLA